METLLIIAVIIGIIQARQEILNVRLGFKPGVKPASSLVDFVFLKNE